MENLLTEIRIIQIHAGKKIIETLDYVATEARIKIYIGEVPKVVLDTSPHMLLELGLGYALANKLQVDESDIHVEDFVIKLHKVMEVSSVCRSADSLTVSVDTIFHIFKDVMNRALMFRKTGCFHVAAIATIDSRIIEVVEDISRHSALYKVVGSAYRKGIDFSKSIIVVSSRATNSIVESIANVCIPIAVFRGAPTSGAIDTARKNSITLIAHAKNYRINVYSGIERISFQ